MVPPRHAHPADDGEPASLRECWPLLLVMIFGAAPWCWLFTAVPLLWFLEAILASCFVTILFASTIHQGEAP
jgi:hypothetical protein